MWHRVDGVPMTTAWDHDDGFMKALSREDAIDATAVPPTRRDGPDAVRNSSNSKKKRPPASCDGNESRRWREGTQYRSESHELRLDDVDLLLEFLLALLFRE